MPSSLDSRPGTQLAFNAVFMIEESLGLFFPSKAILVEIIFSKSISAINKSEEIPIPL